MRDDGQFEAGFILAAIFATAIGWVVVWNVMNHYRAKAVEHGTAEWRIVDPQSGETEFFWKEKP